MRRAGSCIPGAAPKKWSAGAGRNVDMDGKKRGRQLSAIFIGPINAVAQLNFAMVPQRFTINEFLEKTWNILAKS